MRPWWPWLSALKRWRLASLFTRCVFETCFRCLFLVFKLPVYLISPPPSYHRFSPTLRSLESRRSSSKRTTFTLFVWVRSMRSLTTFIMPFLAKWASQGILDIFHYLPHKLNTDPLFHLGLHRELMEFRRLSSLSVSSPMPRLSRPTNRRSLREILIKRMPPRKFLPILWVLLQRHRSRHPSLKRRPKLLLRPRLVTKRKRRSSPRRGVPDLRGSERCVNQISFYSLIGFWLSLASRKSESVSSASHSALCITFPAWLFSGIKE